MLKRMYGVLNDPNKYRSAPLVPQKPVPKIPVRNEKWQKPRPLPKVK